MSSFRQLIAKPDNQEQRDTDIGCHHAAPVNAIFQERFVVLAQSDNQAQHKGEDRTQREEARTVRQILHIAPLQHITATETIVANRNPQPGDKARHPGGVQQPEVHGLVTKHRGQETQSRHHSRRIQRVTRNTATRQFAENTRRFTVACQGVKHTRGGIHPGVTR